jgi:hypothetical protein
MGGYAALRFAAAIGAKTAIAISPQYGVTRRSAPFEHRWRTLGRRVSHADFPPTHGSSIVTPYVFFDPFDFDRKHMQLIAESYPRAHPVPLPHAGHPAGAFLQETRLLSTAIVEIVQGQFDSSKLCAEARRRRRNSGQYFFTLARRLGAWHMRWKIQLTQKAIAAHDDAAYRRYLALLSEMTGNVALAECHYRASLEILPEHPIMLRALATFLIRRNRHEEAEPIARRILAMAPDSNEYFNIYAGTLAALGRSLTLEQTVATIGNETSIYSVKASKRVILMMAVAIANRFGRQSLPTLVVRRIIERHFSIRKDFLSTDEWLDRHSKS